MSVVVAEEEVDWLVKLVREKKAGTAHEVVVGLGVGPKLVCMLGGEVQACFAMGAGESEVGQRRLLIQDLVWCRAAWIGSFGLAARAGYRMESLGRNGRRAGLPLR